MQLSYNVPMTNNHDLVLNKEPAIVIISNSQIGGTNDTHQGSFVYSQTSNIPNVIDLAATSEEDLLQCLIGHIINMNIQYLYTCQSILWKIAQQKLLILVNLSMKSLSLAKSCNLRTWCNA